MGCMLYGAVWLYAHTALYGAVWRCMAVWRRGEGVTMRVCCMERHTAQGGGYHIEYMMNTGHKKLVTLGFLRCSSPN